MIRNFSELEAKMPAAARKKAQAMARNMLADLLLSEVRQLTGMTQKQLAGELGIRQASVSKLENQGDMQVSTLQRIIGALGGQLEIIAHMPQGDIRIQGFPAGRNPTPASMPVRKRRTTTPRSRAGGQVPA